MFPWGKMYTKDKLFSCNWCIIANRSVFLYDLFSFGFGKSRSKQVCYCLCRKIKP